MQGVDGVDRGRIPDRYVEPALPLVTRSPPLQVCRRAELTVFRLQPGPNSAVQLGARPASRRDPEESSEHRSHLAVRERDLEVQLVDRPI